jgi:putative oxidoreductase
MSVFGFLESTDLATLVLRLFIGILFVIHGWPKMKNPKQAAGWVKSTGWAWAAGFAYAFTALEFFGGLALIVGFLTRIAAILFVLEMLATTIFARMKLGKKLMGGWETDLLFLVGALALVFLGAGAWSVDALVGL